jgi:ABC-2 type transport system ATP-binding protein
VVGVALLASGFVAVSNAQPVGSGEAASGFNGSLHAPSPFSSLYEGPGSPDAVAPMELTTTITLLPAGNCTPLSSASDDTNVFPVTYVVNGTQQVAIAGNATISLTTDAGTNVTIGGTSWEYGNIADENEGWVLNSDGTPVNVTSGSTVTLYYYEVTYELVYYSVVNGGNMLPPLLTYTTPPINASSVDQTSFLPVNSSTLSTTPKTFEVIVGSTASVNNPASGNSTVRWATQTSTWGPLTGEGTSYPYQIPEPIEYYRQFNVTTQYSVSGGKGYSAPIVSCPSFGSLVNVTAGASIWVDASAEAWPSFCSYPAVIPGSTSVMRWVTQAVPFLIKGPGSIAQEYQHQFLLNITGGGLSSRWFDSDTTAIITVPGVFSRTTGVGQRVTSYSIDGGTPISVAPTPRNISIPVQMQTTHKLSISSVEQYEVILDGASTAALASITPPTIGGDEYWYDNGTAVTIVLNGVWGREGGTGYRLVSYSLNGGPPTQVDSQEMLTVFSTSSISSPMSLSSAFVTQYLVTFLFTDHSGSTTIAPSHFEADVDGVGRNYSVLSSWFDPETNITVTGVVWEGTESAPVGLASTEVTGPETLKVQTSVYEASLKVTDLFGLPVSGADVSVTFANGTTLSAVTAGDGVASLGLVPAGTYLASVSSIGLTTKISADPAVEAVVTVPLSYPVIGIMLVVAVAAPGAAFLRLRRGRHSELASPYMLTDSISRDVHDQIPEDAPVQFRDVCCKISGKTILRGVTLSVERGEIMGILGRNGAGKTTLLSLISGLRSHSSGEVIVLGETMPARGAEFRRRMGFVLQEDALYQESTVLENLKFSASLYDVQGSQKRIDEVLDLLGLSDRRDQVVSTLSGGLRRRTAIARAFLHDPELFIIDEPTLGVDADARHAVWNYLRMLRSRKRTVIVATNYLDEALALCDRVAVLEDGRLLAVEEPSELVKRAGSCIDIECSEQTATRIASAVAEVWQVTRVDLTLSGISVFLAKGANPDEVLPGFAQYGRIQGYRLRPPDLLEVFKSFGEMA